MIAIKKLFDKMCAARKITHTIFDPPETLLPYRSVKTLDVGLLILLVRSRNSVPVTILMDMEFERLFELRTTIVLQKLYMAIKSSVHALFKKLMTIVCG